MRRTDVVTVCNQFLSFLRGVMGAGGSAPAEERGGADSVAGRGPLGLDLDSLAERILPPSARGNMHVAAVIQAAVDTVVTMLRGAPFDSMAEVRTKMCLFSCDAVCILTFCLFHHACATI